MKKFLGIKEIATSLSLIFSCLSTSNIVHAYAESETLVQVGREVITGYDLNREVVRIRDSFIAQNRDVPNDAGLVHMAVKELVKKHVVLAQSERMGIRISESQIQQALAQVAQQNGLNVEQLPNAIRAQGISFNNYIEDLRDQIALGQIRERIQVRAGDVSEKEINQYLSANPQLKAGETTYSFWAATLPLGHTKEAQRQKLVEELEIYAKSFELGVLPNSDEAIDVRNAEDVNAAALPAQFADVLAQLEEGQVSSPFRSSLGYHVVKLNKVTSQLGTLEQKRYSQIIIAKRNYANDEKAREVAESALSQLDFGTQFDVVVARYSDDPKARENFGDLGWMVAHQFPESFISKVGRLKVGEVSSLIESAVGFHIIKVIDRRNLSTQDAIRESARIQLITEKQQRAFNEWVDEVVKKAYVQVLDPEIGAVYP